MTSPFPVQEPEEKDDDACADCQDGVVVTSAWSNRFRETSRTRLVKSSRRHVSRNDRSGRCCWCCWRPRRTSRHHYVIERQVSDFFNDFFQWPRSRICQREGGADHDERAEREFKRGSVGQSPIGVQGRDLGRGSGGESPLKLICFCQFSYKNVGKVTNLNENLSRRLYHAAMISPKFWSMGGGGRPVRPYSWICH